MNSHICGMHICAPKTCQMNTNMVSAHKALQTWFLASLFVYSSSFISQILDFQYWMICISILDGVTEKTENTVKAHIKEPENFRGEAEQVLIF